MENALQSLTNTLEAINSRQAAARRRARKGVDATPFTSAVLNRERLDIYTYIRDADAHTEANLFWYPPVPQSASASRAGPSSSTHNRSAHSTRSSSAAHLGDDTADANLLLAPRLPEPRQVAPPTPLRNNHAGSTFQGQNQANDDPRLLLMAALRLNETCGKGTRTRKYIKGLLKTHSNLAQSIKSYELQIRQSEAELRANAEGRPGAVASGAGAAHDASHPDNAASALDEANMLLSEVQESIRKEELEILALDEMIGELRQARNDRQKQELQKQQQAALAADVTLQTHERSALRVLPRESLGRSAADDARAQQAVREASQPPAQDDEQELLDSPLDVSNQTADADFVAEEADESAMVAQVQHNVDETVEPDSSFASSHHDTLLQQSSNADADLTIQHGEQDHVESDDANELADNSAAILPADIPVEAVAAHTQESAPSHLHVPAQQSSDELERVTQKVWEVFGDALRFVAPERESSSYADTLDVLKSLMSGGDRPNLGDYSVGSVQTSSTTTTTSEASGAATAAQLTPEVLMTAFVIFQMLVSEEPHQLNIDELKVRGHEWWAASGMQVWMQARSHEEGEVPSRIEAFEDGQNLARKATYGMISKQLFAIRRQKGVGLVGFA
ncbi:hypothetical protein PaG_05791 [Moesziomyces aphidis]|uniref:Uncharacterized protein n=1 Tax=Moesziomyces aphidis TaxID=84754 RepID=W3VFD6_MOEAP|nr:hypothetical protein PaG_05791 [Moesziomyces aphidis]